MAGAIRGSCLCGTVAFVIDGAYSPLSQCHCSKCRKKSGVDGNAVFIAAYQAFRWLSGEANCEVRTGSTWQSHRCATCGSPVPYPNKDRTIYFVPAGLLDDDPGFRGCAQHIFVGSKAAWVVLTDHAQQFEMDAPIEVNVTRQKWPNISR